MYYFCSSETFLFYLVLLAFFSMVVILPMMPLLLFVCTDRQPSVNPRVFDYLYNAAARAAAAKE